MRLPIIELSSRGLEVEPFGSWFKITKVLTDKNYLCFIFYIKDNFAQWKEFVDEMKAAIAKVFEPEAVEIDSRDEPTDILSVD